MSRFHFDEAVMSATASELSNAAQNIASCSVQVQTAVSSIASASGFSIGDIVSDINFENEKLDYCSEGLEHGRVSVDGFIETVKKYALYANKSGELSNENLDILYHIEKNGAGKDFDSYKSAESLFYKKEADAWLYTKVIFSKLTAVGKDNLKDPLKNIADIYEEYYIAAFLEKAYAESDFKTDIIDGIDDYIKIAIKNPAKVSELLTKLNLDPDSAVAKTINEIFNSINMELIDELGDYTGIANFLSDLVKDMLTDYSRSISAAKRIKGVLGDDSRFNKYLDNIIEKYEKDSLGRAVDAVMDFTKGKIVDYVYKATLGSFTAVVDIPASIIQSLDPDIDAFMELQYTSHFASAMQKTYVQLGEKISSGNYTEEDLQKYSNTYSSLRDIYIYRCERMIQIADSEQVKAELESQLSELKNMQM